MSAFSVGDCIGYGWRTFRERPWFLIGVFLLATIISLVPGFFQTPPEVGPDGKIIPHPLTAYEAIVGLVSIIVSIFVSLGYTTVSLRAHDNVQNATLADLWNPGAFWSYLGTAILTVVAVLAVAAVALIPGGILIALLGPDSAHLIILLCILAILVPVYYVILGLSFGGYFVVDRGLGPIGALKESWRIANGHRWKLLLLALAFVGITLLGFLALVVGIFVALPVILVAFAHAYRTLSA